MSSSLDGTHIPPGFEVLKGQENYRRWLRDFQVVSLAKGTWRYYLGAETIPDKPTRNGYGIDTPKGSESDASAPKTTSGKGRRTADSTPEPADVESLTDRIARYRLDLDEWERADKKVRTAMSTLMYCVDTSIRGKLGHYENPHEAWIWFK
jgi:hypothetical protein